MVCKRFANVVGLYIAPPPHAVVLSLDGESQIQALDRTQPGLPMRKGRAGTMIHDYKRHGTTTLFAALNAVERQVPAGKDVHAILDNYATHKHPKVREWLARHPRWTFHFTPTSCSSLNAVDGYFAKLTRRRLKRGVFKASSISRPPSTASSPRPMTTPNPSSGPQNPTPSSPLSAGGKR